MRWTPLTFAFVMLLIGSAQGAIGDLFAQPIGPGVFAVRYDAAGSGSMFKLQRAIGDTQPQDVTDFREMTAEYIDRTKASWQQKVTYHLIEADVEGKELSRKAFTSQNAAELVAQGDFEGIEKLDALGTMQVYAPETWTASLGDDPERHGKVLQFSPKDPEVAPGFSVSSAWFFVSPKTSYRISWWMSESLQGTSSGEGQAYGMTRERVKSAYEKTASLYVDKARRQGNWVGASRAPSLPADIRYIYFTLRGSGYYHDQPIRFDRVSMCDEDLTLVQETDWRKLLEDVAARDGANGKFSVEIGEVRDELNRAATNLGEAKEIDAYLDAHGRLCEAIRRLKRIRVLLRLQDYQLQQAKGAQE